ncbi:MAG: 1-phosphofructokinase [Eubacteriaceae bacterium]|nr:1-phosphofructokinase [Eubacteriaceae bacterium]MDD4508171.1 1-phosphofructokinase [Eubacteriaceae bacterium]
MIYTVTFNPSLDYIASVDHFTPGEVNRTQSELLFPGGKGINVSIVLNNLGMDSVALGFIAGFTGKEIKNRLDQFGCLSSFITIDKGLSRINVKLRSDKETEINGMGPAINEEALNKLYKRLDQLQSGDTLVLAGSIPASMPADIYEKIMAHLNQKKIHVVVDATRDLLLNVLKYHPFLIKPNNHELGEMFGTILKSPEEIIDHARKLQRLGAKNVLVSMAGDGAILVSESGEIYSSPAPVGRVKNSVGAGDSMVAGFLTGYSQSESIQKAFEMGLATGSASAFSDNLATKEEVERLLKTIKVTIF